MSINKVLLVQNHPFCNGLSIALATPGQSWVAVTQLLRPYFRLANLNCLLASPLQKKKKNLPNTVLYHLSNEEHNLEVLFMRSRCMLQLITLLRQEPWCPCCRWVQYLRGRSWINKYNRHSYSMQVVYKC